MARLSRLEAHMTEYLVMECGKEPRQDAEYSGYVKCIRDVRNLEIGDLGQHD